MRFALLVGVGLTLSASSVFGQDIPQNFRSQRATLLADHLADAVSPSAVDSMGYVLGAFGVVGMGLSTVLFATLPDVTAEGTEGPWLFAAASGMMALGGFGSYLVDEDYYQKTFLITADFSMGTVHLGLGTMGERFSPTMGIVAAAGYLRGSLHFFDAMARRPISRRRLAVRYAAIATPEQRARTTTADLRETERAFERFGSYLSPWLLQTPMFLGGAGCLALLADEDATSEQRTHSAVYGGVLLSQGLIFALASNAYDRYVSRTKGRGFEIAFGSGPGLGVGMHGRF